MAANPRAIPLADLRELRFPLLRTAVVRFGLAALLLALLAGAWWLVRGDDPATGKALIPGAQGGVIVLDLSASIGSTPHLRTSNALRYVQQTRQSFGMVMFSDTAYEAVPPGPPFTEMASFMRHFGHVRLYPCIRRGMRSGISPDQAAPSRSASARCEASRVHTYTSIPRARATWRVTCAEEPKP